MNVIWIWLNRVCFAISVWLFRFRSCDWTALAYYIALTTIAWPFTIWILLFENFTFTTAVPTRMCRSLRLETLVGPRHFRFGHLVWNMSFGNSRLEFHYRETGLLEVGEPVDAFCGFTNEETLRSGYGCCAIKTLSKNLLAKVGWGMKFQLNPSKHFSKLFERPSVIKSPSPPPPLSTNPLPLDSQRPSAIKSRSPLPPY